MKLRKNSGKILWGLFFILAAVYVVVSKLWIMPEISVFSVLLTVFFIWLFLNGIRNVNFWEILFSIAFICIIYDDQLGITALTPWTVLGAALLGSIGLSLIFKKKSGHSPSISFEFDSDSDNEDGKYIGENIKIDMDGGNEVYMNIIPQWDGEDECFDLNNLTSSEIRQFPNLKKATIMSSNFDKVKEIFDAENIDVELL